MAKIISVGCGAMGSALIASFLDQGHDVTIVDLNQNAALPYVERGAHFATELKGCPADADLIVLDVPSYPIATSIVNTAPHGFLDNKIVVNLVTASFDDVEAFVKVMNEKGSRYIEGSIECYPTDIGKETGFIVYSGDVKAYKEVEDILRAISPEPVFLGENILLATIFDIVTLTLFYALTWSVLQSSALCVRNGFPIETLKSYIYPILEPLVKGMAEGLKLDDKADSFVEAQVVSVDILEHGGVSIIDSMKKSKLDTSVLEAIQKLIVNTAHAGYGKMDYESIITQILK